MLPHIHASAPTTGAHVCPAGLLPILTLTLSLILTGPALARPKPALKDLDLDVRTGDVKVQPRPPLAAPPPPVAAPSGPPIDPNALAQTDQVERGEIPNRRRGATGIDSGEGSVLEQLLEDHTIPLFRLKMDSPF
jgi:hypothetical protein